MSYQNATDSTETTMQELNTHMINVLERIADSLESLAADAERIADMLALFGQKGAQNDR